MKGYGIAPARPAPAQTLRGAEAIRRHSAHRKEFPASVGLEVRIRALLDFCCQSIEIKSAHPPRFFGSGATLLAGNKVLKRGQQKRAEASLPWSDCTQRSAFNQVLKETLHEILGILGTMSTVTGNGV
jgi:hypothetical protein